MRIVSLVPAATEWLAVFGALDQVVGRSHACDYPPGVTQLPSLTATKKQSSPPHAIALRTLGTALADAADPNILTQENFGWMVDIGGLVDLEPDLVVVHEPVLRSESRAALELISTISRGPVPEIVDFAPATFKQILDSALALGKSLGKMGNAMRVIAQHEQTIRQLHSLLGLQTRSRLEERPTALCLQSIDPLVIAGGWIPDMIELAGGRVPDALYPDHAAAQVKRARPETGAGIRQPVQINWEDVRRTDPDTLIFMLCGEDLESARRRIAQLRASAKGWSMLGAASEERVYVVPSAATFSRPGPRLYRGIELLALALYPEMLANHVSLGSDTLTKIESPEKTEDQQDDRRGGPR